MLRILVIDGQSGGIGKQVVSAIKKEFPDSAIELIAVGTNSLATAAMLKAGADHAATGENAVISCCRKADIIIGPIGIVIADALWGEISPAMAQAIGQSSAKRLLLPMNLCDNTVIGVANLKVGFLIQETIQQIKAILEKNIDR